MITYLFTGSNFTEVKDKYISLIIVGAFTPVTMEGNIVVDGVLASCYALCQHDLAHLGMAPIHLFPNAIKWFFGEQKGIPDYIKIVGDLGTWVIPDIYFWQIIK